MERYDVIVIGAGLAGLSSSYYLAKENKKVLLIEKENFLGGRTSSCNDNGMEIEAGFHRHIGYYKEFPKLLKEVGVSLNDIIMWEDEFEIRLDNKNSIIMGIAPFYAPIKFIRGILGNNNYLSFKEKMRILILFIKGFWTYTFNSEKLDNYSIDEYAKLVGCNENICNNFITPLCTGIFFLPKEEYSAKVFFGLFYHGLYRMFKIRIGAYKGGMSKVIANPIGNKIKELNGTILLNTFVNKINIKNNKVEGVELADGNVYKAKKVILATDITSAKNILKNSTKKEFNNIYNMPTMSAISVQLELKERVLEKDQVIFAPHTILQSFTEESNSTFKSSKGRLSIIIGNPDKYIDLNNQTIYELVLKDAKKLGLDLKDKVLNYRVVRHKNKFYKLSPLNDKNRPYPKTNITGLVLAGDYIVQKFYATMEGAVISGINAAKLTMNLNQNKSKKIVENNNGE